MLAGEYWQRLKSETSLALLDRLGFSDEKSTLRSMRCNRTRSLQRMLAEIDVKSFNFLDFLRKWTEEVTKMFIIEKLMLMTKLS